jgi:hypothetical protein
MLKNKIWQLLKGKEGYSSKRFIALWSIIILVTPIVFTYTNDSNLTTVLTILTSFICTLVGVTVYQNIKDGKTNY